MSDLIKAPRELRDKTGAGVPGGGRAIVKKAELAAKRHLDRVDYRSIAQESLDRLRHLTARLDDSPDDKALCKQIYEVAHNLRGEGSSFGYPAVSQVAELICRMTDRSGALTKPSLRIIKVQIDALRAMVRYNVKGAPQGLAMDVITALATLVDRFTTILSGRR